MAFVSQGSRGLPAEVDNFAVLGTSGRWTASAIPTAAISGAPAGNNRKGLKGSGDWSSDPQSIVTLGRGLSLETFDIASCSGALALSTGQLFGVGFGAPAGSAITGLVCGVTVGSSTTTHWWFALYDSLLNLLAQTADSPAAVNVTNAFVALPLTAQVAVAADAYYYAALLTVGTSPQVLNASTTAAVSNAQFSGNPRRAFGQTGLAAVPNPAVPNSATPAAPWFGVY